MTAPRRVDTHLHLWNLQRCSYPWLGPRHGRMYRTFGPDDVAADLRAAGVDAAVLVQAADSDCDTEVMLEHARTTPWIVGVVGWLDLRAPGTVQDVLDAGRRDELCGVRHLVHDDPDPQFLADPDVRASLRLLAGAGLAFDVPDAWPAHLAEAGRIADEIDELTVVVDHLGKPPVGGDLREWGATLRRVAAHGNTVAKVSGLATSLVAGASWSPATVRPVWEIALDEFGPDRLMYGGDWPMTLSAGGYAPVWEVVSALIGELGPAEQAAIMGDTACRVYGL